MTQTALQEDITEQLSEMRQVAGLTQVELARRLGWSDEQGGNVSKYELGRSNPGTEFIRRWAKACGFTVTMKITSEDGNYTWLREL